MNFIEFLGFIISVGAMVFLFVRQTYENYRRHKYPEQYAEEVKRKDDSLRQLFKEMNIEIEDEELEEDELEELLPRPPQQRVPPPPPPPPQKFRPAAVVKKSAAGLLQEQRATEEQFKEYSSERMNPTTVVSEKDAYALGKTARASKGKALVDGIRSRQDMFILKEILDAPRCDREWR